MFEKAVIFSAVFTFTGFCLASTKLFNLIGLKAESPIAVIQEMFPPMNTSEVNLLPSNKNITTK